MGQEETTGSKQSWLQSMVGYVGWTRIITTAVSRRTLRKYFSRRRAKKRGNNKYIIFATYEGFDLNKDPSEQKELYDGIMKTQADFYEEVIEYYKDRHDVKCYVKGGECDSDSDNEEDS